MSFLITEEQLLGLREKLQSGLDELGLKITPEQVDMLLSFLEVLGKWNKKFNLSGIKKPSEMISRHLLDCLAVSPYIEGSVILDVGSGGGLPGIPLAILHPDKHFILLDSNGKKTRFLFQVKLALGLDNITIENKRIEDYQCTEQIDIVMSRAFSSLAKLVQSCASVAGENSKLLAMKGIYPTTEIEELPEGIKISRAIELTIPGIEGVRHLIEIPFKQPSQ
ncbi:MAG: 16S rRNA (guanine(527)-N(7))-methyltransferase RsmG [Gammaproteobacteria bacterium]|nr:16S rRNA (guanine(527)-N(7))-methyltransferase RsmG [Gammaproteobacteria bacterium]